MTNLYNKLQWCLLVVTLYIQKIRESRISRRQPWSCSWW